MKRALSVLAFALFACTANFANAATTRIFITSGTSFTIPADWNSQDNSIEIIGAGGFGNDCSGITSIGGGGGAYSKISNFAASPGASISLNFTPNAGATRGFAWFSTSTTVLAEYGGDAGGGAGCSANGGRAANGFGTVKFDGGSGGIGSGGGSGTGAGGGAAGPHGAGAAPAGIDATTGGAADAGFGGAGGVGGLAPGGNGTEFDASHGAGGGGGTDASGNGGIGGNYGGGGGYQALGSGALIVVTYTTRVRVSSGVF